MVKNSTIINRINIQLAPQIIEHKKTKINPGIGGE